MSEIDTSKKPQRYYVPSGGGVAPNPCGLIYLREEADAMINALSAERDVAVARAEHAEARERALLSTSEEARQFLRQRGALRIRAEQAEARVAKMSAAYADLRAAVQAGDVERAQAALDRYEPWADYVLGGGITQAAAALSEIAAISGGPIRRIALDALDKMETD